MVNLGRLPELVDIITTKNLFNCYKLVLCLSSLLYGLSFGFATGILTFLLCSLFCQLPILFIHFNDLRVEFIKPQTVNNVRPTKLSREPYFLVEHDNATVMVNDSLEKFLNGVLEKFVINWQGTFETDEEHFIIELRHTIKYIVIKLYKLIKQVDLSKLIIEKVMPLSLWHLDCYSTGQNNINEDRNLEKNVLTCFGKNLHQAVESRKAEELYLRCYSQRLLHYLLPPQLKKSKLLTILLRDILSCQIFQNAMDALADPDNINQLIILWLDQDIATGTSDQENLDFTPILHNFTMFSPSKPEPCIYPSFSSILKTPPHLYHLMQFLKRESSLKYLQFCFAVDEFNEKLLNPDLKRDQLERLQLTGRKLFDIFFSGNSPDRIHFGAESKIQMKKIVYGNVEDIVLLRTCPTLFEAYDHVMDVLENKILIRFYRSSEFYQLLRDMQQDGGFPSNIKKKNESDVGGWSKKIRSALRPPGWLLMDAKPGSSATDSEEASYDTAIDLTEAEFIPDELDDQDYSSSYRELIPICGRDLTCWRAFIPRVVTAMDSAGKPIWAFEVDVQRIDLRPEDDPDEYHWAVIRTYAEFYNLESKLTEFHGEFLETHLPAKKMFGTGKSEFLESVRLEFESFLRTLLQQPALKGSDLIFSFLTLSNLSACQTVSDSTLVGSNILPDLGFGRMIRHVPLKLRKERGQHLENFLQSFIASTEAPKPRPSKVEGRDSITNEVALPVVQDLHPVYQNNAKNFLDFPVATGRTVNPLKLDGPFDCLLFIAWRIWVIPKLWWNALVGLGSCLKDLLDFLAQKYISIQLSQALRPEKLVLAIKLLHETVLHEKTSTVGREIENKRHAWNCIIESFPQWMKKSFGVKFIEDKCEMVFQCLQYPVFNKQLSYVLFETAFREICPEIFEEDAEELFLGLK